jgi:hypothetical protein
MPQFYTEKTGKFIDTWIRLKRRIDKYQKSVTDYVNHELANKSDLSGRQIERMRRCDGFPEDKSMNKLINAIPELASLNCSNFVERLLLPFEIVLQAQERIQAPSKGQFNTIVIISGWIKPLGIEQQIIAEATTENITNEFEYVFLYPDPQTYPGEVDLPDNHEKKDYSEAVENITESWIDDLRKECEIIQFRKLMKTQKNREDADRKLMEFRDLAEKKISRIHTKQENSNFWFLLPSNYTVLYNPNKSPESDFHRYGVFNIKGKIVEFSDFFLQQEEIDSNFTNRSEGWLYIDDTTFEELAKTYSKLQQQKMI